jgi:acetylornithine/succinyldiaminopimelate/putrescine aminotransferase
MKKSSAFLDKHLAQTTFFPFNLEIDHAKGIYLYDKDGKSYIDMISGVGVSSLGHGVKEIKDALKAQIDKHLHVMVYGEFHQSAPERFSELLCKQLPEDLNSVYFVNSGTEAVEAALKLAKRASHRTQLIACEGAYHGSTHGSLSVSSNPVKKRPFLPLLPDVHFVRFNEIEDLDKIGCRTAAVIVETVQGDAGIRIPDAQWLLALRKRCDEMGALLIFDEIQAGMGRTGKLFAFEHFGVSPDILVLGKALGGGLPIGAVVAHRDKMALFADEPMLGHITTFGGHPLPCASGHAALQYLIEHGILNGVESKGRFLKKGLESHPKVKEVRQIGLFMAIDLDSSDAVQQVVSRCLENGLIGFWFLSHPYSFRLAPPLTISEAELKKALDIILEALDGL